MTPLTEKQVRASFVNASKREANQATLPDLAAINWDGLDYLAGGTARHRWSRTSSSPGWTTTSTPTV